MRNQSTVNPKINIQSIKSLSDHYLRLYGVNPLCQTRHRTALIPRQCLSFILRHKFNVGYSELGRLLEKNHATMIHAESRVMDALAVRDKQYVDVVNRWAVVFQDVMPRDAREMWSLQDRLRAMMEQTMLDNAAKAEILRELLKFYSEDVVKVPEVV